MSQSHKSVNDCKMPPTFKSGGRRTRDAAGKATRQAQPAGHGRAMEQEARQVLRRLQGLGQCRQALQARAHDQGEREARLSKQGWRVHIQRKGSKDKPISDTQQRRNHRIAKTRARIEQVGAALAQMGG